MIDYGLARSIRAKPVYSRTYSIVYPWSLIAAAGVSASGYRSLLFRRTAPARFISSSARPMSPGSSSIPRQRSTTSRQRARNSHFRGIRVHIGFCGRRIWQWLIIAVFAELARVLVRFDHVARLIVNAKESAVLSDAAGAEIKKSASVIVIRLPALLRLRQFCIKETDRGAPSVATKGTIKHENPEKFKAFRGGKMTGANSHSLNSPACSCVSITLPAAS